MKTTSVRFSDDIYGLIKAEAAQCGVGVTQYIREAAYGRALIARSHKGLYTETEPLNRAIRAFLAADRNAAG